MAHLLIETSTHVARLVIAKPPANVLDIALMRELRAALDSLRRDAAVKVVVLAAQGKLFSAGVDVKEHTADRVAEMIHEFHALIHALETMPQPTVAAVQGHALGGGCELALACDLVVASAAAKFSQPEIHVGVFPPIAALRLPQMLPRKKAFEMVLTGASMAAQEALALGLINQVAAPESFESDVAAFVQRLTNLSGAVLRATKRALNAGADDAARLAEIERIYLDELMPMADANEGLAAFIEKRKPVWQEP
ncbi:MAG: enoyl-CoA hydratase/isomerase family protein [Chloroflexi bacterium]|nr:enoyl-CoA hydratase/isomerase family protein [Chloroflexota bacterium]